MDKMDVVRDEVSVSLPSSFTSASDPSSCSEGFAKLLRAAFVGSRNAGSRKWIRGGAGNRKVDWS